MTNCAITVRLKMAVVTTQTFAVIDLVRIKLVSEISRVCQPNWYQKLVLVCGISCLG